MGSNSDTLLYNLAMYAWFLLGLCVRARMCVRACFLWVYYLVYKQKENMPSLGTVYLACFLSCTLSLLSLNCLLLLDKPSGNGLMINWTFCRISFIARPTRQSPHNVICLHIWGCYSVLSYWSSVLLAVLSRHVNLWNSELGRGDGLLLNRTLTEHAFLLP